MFAFNYELDFPLIFSIQPIRTGIAKGVTKEQVNTPIKSAAHKSQPSIYQQRSSASLQQIQ
jgi:hypothetical protein